MKQFEAVGASDEITAVHKKKPRLENKSIDLIRAGGGISAHGNEDYVRSSLNNKNHRGYKSMERKDY